MRFKINNARGASVDSDPKRLQASRRFNLQDTVGSVLDFIESHEMISAQTCGAEECALDVFLAYPKKAIARADAEITLLEFGFASNTLVWAVVE